MKMDEQTLISEGNKYLRQQREKTADRTPQKLQERTPQKPQERPKDRLQELDNFFPDNFIEEEFGILVEDVIPDAPPSTIATPKHAPPNDLFKARLYFQEQAFVKLLILHGQTELEAGITLCRYLLHEIGEIAFENQLFDLILNIFRQRFNAGDIPSTNYFLNHIDPDIQRLTIDLCTNKHHLSENWSKYEIIVPTDEDLLHEIAFKKILRLKMAYSADKIKDLLNQMGQIKGNSDEEFAQIMEIQRQYKFYKSINDAAAKELGTVVPGY